MKKIILLSVSVAALSACTPPPTPPVGKLAPIAPINLDSSILKSATAKITLANASDVSLLYGLESQDGWLKMPVPPNGELEVGEVKQVEITATCLAVAGTQTGRVTVKTRFGEDFVVPVKLNCAQYPTGNLSVKYQIKQPFLSYLMGVTAPAKISLLDQNGKEIEFRDIQLTKNTSFDHEIVFQNVPNGSYTIAGLLKDSSTNILDSATTKVRIFGKSVDAALDFPLASQESNKLRGRIPQIPEGATVKVLTPTGASNGIQVKDHGEFSGDLQAPANLNSLKEIGIPSIVKNCKNTMEVSDQEAKISVDSLLPDEFYSKNQVFLGDKLLGEIVEEAGSGGVLPLRTGRVYVDRDVTIKFNFDCSSVNYYRYDANLSLQKGWNYFVVNFVFGNIKSESVWSAPNLLTLVHWKPAP